MHIYAIFDDDGNDGNSDDGDDDDDNDYDDDDDDDDYDDDDDDGDYDDDDDDGALHGSPNMPLPTHSPSEITEEQKVKRITLTF
ncbi:hypothetical protein ElyMa_006241300 [Elysia marginata]|uniref:Uncharacterized protein n=1 Tax=Elysia marginata TaxID=1093978 RepID=A0AAV4H8M6_9GAST|nr:hypothetical protein ElyMa_006241300 [Elysia marginata]